MSYKGKYPKRIKSVYSTQPRGTYGAETNDGTRVEFMARDNPATSPGEFIGREVTTLTILPRCAWFARCDNAATQTEPHPILGDVPICARCADWCRNMERKTRREEVQS